MSVAESHTAAPSASQRQPYPAYKDSGVEWLGDVPQHWNTGPLKYYVNLVSRGDSPDYVDESGIRVINQACVQWNGLRLSNVKFQREADVASWKGKLIPGDLLMNSTGTGTLGRVALFDAQGTYIADSHVTIVRCLPTLLSERYLFYLMQTTLYQGYVYSAIVSGATNQVELSKEGLRVTPVIVPPLPEQHAIAAFLDRETAKTDALIAKKERQIELLRERRAVFVSHIVTKGLDSSVPTKESGVEWLGDIPEHWEIKRLRFIAQVRTGVAKGRTVVLAETVQLPYLRVANVQDGYLNLEDVATITVGADEVTRYALKQGDVLMNEGGDFDKLGRGAVWNGQISPCLHQNHVFAVRPRRGTDPHWLAAVTSTSYAKHYFIINSRQSTNLASISSTNLAELPVVMPPFEERSAILKRIEAETAGIDALITKVQEHIDKLREHRTALISAAVTGKIDVREGTV